MMPKPQAIKPSQVKAEHVANVTERFELALRQSSPDDYLNIVLLDNNLESYGAWDELALLAICSNVQAIACLNGFMERNSLEWSERRAWREKLGARRERLIETGIVPLEERRKKGGSDDKPTAQDYDDFFTEYLPNNRKDLLTGSLFYRATEAEPYAPAANLLPILRSYSRSYRASLYSSHIDDELARFNYERSAELLIDIPEWDGIDRVAKACECLVGTVFPPDVLEALVKEHLRLTWLHAFDPEVRNTMLILRSEKQNIGKDTWLRTVYGGWGEGGYFKTIEADGSSDEINLMIHSALIGHIEELDRLTGKQAAAFLKNLITRVSTNVRLKYERTDVYRPVRCSYIASVNPETIFEDPTGCSRFTYIEIDRIVFDYPGHQVSESKLERSAIKLQYLAQSKWLGENAAPLDPAINKLNMAYLKSKLPQSDDDSVIELYEQLCILRLKDCIKSQGYGANADLIAVFKEIGDHTKWPVQRIWRTLKRKGLSWRDNKIRGYYLSREWASMTASDNGDSEVTDV